MADATLHICPSGSKHFFKDMRAKSKAAGPPWRFFMRCAKCTTMFVQIVSEVVVNGDIRPKVSAYLITSSGRTIPIAADVKKTDPVPT